MVPIFSSIVVPWWKVCLMLAERLGSPVISMVWVGVPEKGFWSLTRNSPEGGGAIERGMLICVCVCWWGLDVIEVCLKSQWTDSDEEREERASNVCREEYKNRELKVEHVSFCR